MKTIALLQSIDFVLRIGVASLVIALAGCSIPSAPVTQSSATSETIPQKCETQVKYQGSTVKATGIELPIGATNPVKIASVDYQPISIRQVSTALTLLDQMQFASCQQAKLASNNATRDKVILEYQRNLATYLRIITALKEGDAEVVSKETEAVIATKPE